MFTIALFTITRFWDQPKCLSAHDQTQNMCCVHTVEFYSTIKKNKIRPFAETTKFEEKEDQGIERKQGRVMT